jgi:hypothetical protein
VPRLEIQDMLYIIIHYMNPEILYDARYWKKDQGFVKVIFKY